MLATDKQVEYLTRLQEKWNALAEITNQKKHNLDWRHERSIGMTTIDASIRIKAFKDGIFAMNMQRSLLGI